MKTMVADIEDFHGFFANGMGRALPAIVHDGRNDTHVNLGAGNSPVPFADNLDLPDWTAPNLPYSDGSVSVVHAYHFLEHLSTWTLLKQLREVERVLVPGGIFNVVVPYARADIAYQDITHESFFTEETWKTLFSNDFYDPNGPWKFEIGINLIAGIVGRNLAIFTQLIKES